ncbi:MAG TPA: ComEC/Rec2 family competence protein [Candidatus Lustribacter sp.]|nr:ComEC/Rec2 family competence protein [Candidatus Lustribacter sp.]
MTPNARQGAAVEVSARRADVRLLVPGLWGWALVAAVSGLDVGQQVLVLVASAVVTVWGLWLMSVRAARGRPGSLPGLLATTGAVSALLVGALIGHRASADAGPVAALAAGRAVVTVTARVQGDPRSLAPTLESARAPRVVVALLVTQIDGRGTRTEVRSPVLAFGGPDLASVRWGQAVVATGRLRAADPGDNQVALLDVRGAPRVVEPEPALLGAAEVVRERFRTATSGLAPDARGLVPALVIGDTSRTPSNLTAAMLTAGMTHLSAVSGSNVSLVLTAWLGLCRLAGVPRRWRPGFAGVGLVLFVVLARPEPSVVRAAVMGAVGLLGLSTSRRGAGLPALATAIVALLVWDPWLARSYGFALSCLATLGLVLFARPWGEAIGARLPARIAGWGPALAIPVIAQVMCAPVVVLLQGSVSVVAIPANLAAAPFVAPATFAGLATAVVSVVWPAAGAVVAWGAALPALAIAWVARTAATLPGATLPWPDGAGGALLLVGVSLAAVLSGPWVRSHARSRPLLAVAVVVLGAATATPTLPFTWPPPGWTAVFCDVGQGDAAVVATAPGHALVVDAGPDPRLVDGCLRRLGIEVVDAIVLTHFHADHVAGLSGVLGARPVGEILVSPVPDPPYEAHEVSRLAQEAGVPVRTVYAGDDLRWGSHEVHVWWPARALASGSVPNNGSLVVTLRGPTLNALMLGDIEREASQELVGLLRRAPPAELAPFDVVKVAHHGSANRDEELMALVHAPTAVISVGADNDYGHPAWSTLRELVSLGYAVARTDRDGDIAISREPGAAPVLTRRGPG